MILEFWIHRVRTIDFYLYPTKLAHYTDSLEM
jgi:hypothetical protein